MNNNQTLAEAQAGLEAVENAIEVRSTLDTNFVIKKLRKARFRLYRSRLLQVKLMFQHISRSINPQGPSAHLATVAQAMKRGLAAINGGVFVSERLV